MTLINIADASTKIVRRAMFKLLVYEHGTLKWWCLMPADDLICAVIFSLPHGVVFALPSMIKPAALAHSLNEPSPLVQGEKARLGMLWLAACGGDRTSAPGAESVQPFEMLLGGLRIGEELSIH